jgi:hypothetical protein
MPFLPGALLMLFIVTANPVLLFLLGVRTLRRGLAIWSYSVTLREDSVSVTLRGREASIRYSQINSLEVLRAPPSLRLGLTDGGAQRDVIISCHGLRGNGEPLANMLATHLAALHPNQEDGGSA